MWWVYGFLLVLLKVNELLKYTLTIKKLSIHDEKELFLPRLSTKIIMNSKLEVFIILLCEMTSSNYILDVYIYVSI